MDTALSNPQTTNAIGPAPLLPSVSLAAKTKKAAIAEAVERFGFESAVKPGVGDSFTLFLHGPKSAKLYVTTVADVRKGRSKAVGASLVFTS